MMEMDNSMMARYHAQLYSLNYQLSQYHEKIRDIYVGVAQTEYQMYLHHTGAASGTMPYSAAIQPSSATPWVQSPSANQKTSMPAILPGMLFPSISGHMGQDTYDMDR